MTRTEVVKARERALPRLAREAREALDRWEVLHAAGDADEAAARTEWLSAMDRYLTFRRSVDADE